MRVGAKLRVFPVQGDTPVRMFNRFREVFVHLVSFYVIKAGQYPPTINLPTHTPSKPKSQRRETTESDRRLIWSYHEDGRSYGWISERLEINYSTVDWCHCDAANAAWSYCLHVYLGDEERVLDGLCVTS